jgi:hypothetical protein
VRDAENERLGEFTARTLYFHPSTEGTTLLYGLSAYQERFGAGNSRGMPLPELENVLRDGRERLEAAGVRGVDLRLANVSTPKIGPPPEEMAHLAAAPNPLQRRFCIWVDAEAYRDASPKFYNGVDYDYGEDFGRDVVALARALGRFSRDILGPTAAPLGFRPTIPAALRFTICPGTVTTTTLS